MDIILTGSGFVNSIPNNASVIYRLRRGTTTAGALIGIQRSGGTNFAGAGALIGFSHTSIEILNGETATGVVNFNMTLTMVNFNAALFERSLYVQAIRQT